MLSFGRRPQSSDRAVLDAIRRSLAVIQFTPDGTILDANENFCSALGYSLEEIRGRHHRLFVDSETARSPEYDAFWRKLGSGAFDSGEYKRIGKAGDEVWIQAAYSPVLSDSGQVEKVVKFASNITANKQAALDSRGKIEAISRSQAVIEFSTEGLVQDANANFLAVMGYKLEDILGSHHRLFMRPEAASSPEYGQFWKKLAAGEFVSGEFERIGKGGRTVWIQASYNPIKAPDGQVTKVVKYATDVTGRVNAVAELASGLGRMAAGDLTQPIEKPFTPELDRIRGDFNRSLAQLNQAMRHISSDARSLRDGMAEIQMAADDLSVRTEQQAVLGQRTAGALAEVTQSISDTARRSAKASGLAAETKASAEHSSQVVGRAVEAMRNIKHSSDSIAAIISVIDEIAFQTNLLALNASIEAARAGVAGRGFSVVAAEVRALAQRSAQAAKEIATLIGDAGGHVSEGVELVEETGAALGEIATQVIEVFANVEAISSSATAQSKALGSVNQSVACMDDATQQNAAMVEETTAATHSLSHRLSDLIALLDGFKVEAVSDSTGRPHDYSSAA